MTRRGWVLLVIGSLLVGATGGFALANRGESATFKPTASWNMFPPAQWQALRTHAAGRGFAPGTLHVVAAASKHDGTPIAILAGRNASRSCFLPAYGRTLGATICTLKKPLILFAFRDRFGGHPAVDVLGLARRSVPSVVQEFTIDGKPWKSGVVLMRVPGAFAFGGGSAGTQATFVGRSATGRVLTRVHVAPFSS